MPRKPRFAPPGYSLHITQRGNNRQPVFTTDADHHHFLNLLDTRSEERHVRLASYSLMWNHFHLVAVGDRPEAISRFMMDGPFGAIHPHPPNSAIRGHSLAIRGHPLASPELP